MAEDTCGAILMRGVLMGKNGKWKDEVEEEENDEGDKRRQVFLTCPFKKKEK
jgi:hypothetical protein